MRNLKYTMGTAAASATLWLAPVAPVAADSNTENSFNTTSTVTTTVDESKTIHIGDCVVMMDDIKVWLDQYNKQKNSQSNVNADLGGGGFPYLLSEENGSYGGEEGSSSSQSNTSGDQSQSNSQSVVITIAPDCSVTNVTEVSQAAAVKGAQTEAAKGGVGAGFGGVASSFAATIGVAASALGAGLGLRRFGN